ncbi:MAG: GAF domain-containing protein [Acidobacteria bacterium]|nr:GAF domain-containing protein [Acidobacteriota bacterium]
MKTSDIEMSLLSGELDKFVIGGLNRFVFLCDPSNYAILYRSGALNERVVSGDDALSSILSENSVNRLEALARSVRGVHFTYDLEFRLSSGLTVGSYGSLKRIFFHKKELILGVFYFDSDTGAEPRFRPGFSMDITRQVYWVGNMDKTFFANECLSKTFDVVGEKIHLLDLCVKEDRNSLEGSLRRALKEGIEQAEYAEVDFSVPGKGIYTFQLRMVRGVFGSEKVVRVVFLETDSWIFQLEINTYHRRLEMAASCFAGDYMRENVLETALGRILEEAGQLLDASRGFILQLFPDLNRIAMTHEWSALGVERVQRLSSYALERVKHFFNFMSQGRSVTVHSKREAELALHWESDPHIADSFLLVPIFRGKDAVGFVGFGDIRFERFWTCGEQQFVDKVAKTVGMFMDRAHLLDSLKNEKIKAEEASKVKEKFLATVSHEVRNPLNAIIGLSRMLLEQGVGEDDPIQRQALEFIQVNGRNLSRIMEEILNLSKLNLYDRMPDLQPINISELMSELENYLLGRLYGVKTITGDVHLTDLPQSLVTDKEFILRILMNLLDNAVKFTEKGTVSLTAEVDEENICFHVTDTGLGIEPQYLEKIFEDFYQVEQVNTRKHGGIGAGLAIVRKMADAINARVSVSSTQGKGSRFTLSVPVGEGVK